jgi:hypothetical protein
MTTDGQSLRGAHHVPATRTTDRDISILNQQASTRAW